MIVNPRSLRPRRQEEAQEEKKIEKSWFPDYKWLIGEASSPETPQRRKRSLIMVALQISANCVR